MPNILKMVRDTDSKEVRQESNNGILTGTTNFNANDLDSGSSRSLKFDNKYFKNCER